jgi:hypothetical protein
VNKIIPMLISLVMASRAFAEVDQETVIVLLAINQRGVEIKREVVIINNSSVIVNKEKLSPVEIITQSNNIKKINQFLPNDKFTQCESGTFKHIYKKGPVQKEELGCLSSMRFNHLEKSFKGLKKDRVTD